LHSHILRAPLFENATLRAGEYVSSTGHKYHLISCSRRDPYPLLTHTYIRVYTRMPTTKVTSIGGRIPESSTWLPRSLLRRSVDGRTLLPCVVLPIIPIFAQSWFPDSGEPRIHPARFFHEGSNRIRDRRVHCPGTLLFEGLQIILDTRLVYS
jgi:hypothetical protein